MLNPQLDVVVWILVALVLVLLGARAWAVETGAARPGRAPAKVRVLTVASVFAIGGLFTMMWIQGGWLLFDALVNGTDPEAVLYPAAPPADPAAPPPAGPAPADGAPAAPAGAGDAPAPAGGAPAAPPAGG
jgi:hypothetical protein